MSLSALTAAEVDVADNCRFKVLPFSPAAPRVIVSAKGQPASGAGSKTFLSGRGELPFRL